MFKHNKLSFLVQWYQFCRYVWKEVPDFDYYDHKGAELRKKSVPTRSRENSKG